MSSATFHLPEPFNETVLGYAPGTPERRDVKIRLSQMKASPVEIPLLIGGEEVKTGNTGEIVAPHDHSVSLGVYHKAGAREVERAIHSALKARKAWAFQAASRVAAAG